MDPKALNLTTEILGYSLFCFVGLEAARADATLARAIDALGAAMENMHEVDGNPSEEARARGRYQYLRAEASRLRALDIEDAHIARANILIRLEARSAEPINAYGRALRSLLEPRAATLSLHLGISKPRSYTSYAMTQFAYAHALAPKPASRHPFGVVTPQNKTAQWWALDWMRRESFFLPRYDAQGRMIAQGHALASAAGVPYINRRLVHNPAGYGTGEGYDFIGYFEFAQADAPLFDAVMAGLRDKAQNPEWAYVREGPEWWGRRVSRAEALWSD
jgi:hypothetical protein